jgi:hypothetical protein
MSLLLRQEKKGRRTKVGIFVCMVGAALLGVGIFGSMRGGAEFLAMWAIAFGLAGLAIGVYTLRKAATSRW